MLQPRIRRGFNLRDDVLGQHFAATTPPVITGEYRVGDIRHGYADLARIHALLGFSPEVSLDQGLTRFAAWVRTQPTEPDRLERATEELVKRGLMKENSRARRASV